MSMLSGCRGSFILSWHGKCQTYSHGVCQRMQRMKNSDNACRFNIPGSEKKESYGMSNQSSEAILNISESFVLMRPIAMARRTSPFGRSIARPSIGDASVDPMFFGSLTRSRLPQRMSGRKSCGKAGVKAASCWTTSDLSALLYIHW